jgi:hypothetical protein
MMSPITRVLLVALTFVALGGCDSRPKHYAWEQADAAAAAKPLPGYVAEMRKSAAACKAWQADISTIYEKPQSLVVRVQNAKEFNYKYLKKESTHLAFEVECGTGVTFNAYGPIAKLEPLKAYIDGNPPPPRTVAITVMTDKSHGNPGVFTLLDWRKVD